MTDLDKPVNPHIASAFTPTTILPSIAPKDESQDRSSDEPTREARAETNMQPLAALGEVQKPSILEDGNPLGEPIPVPEEQPATKPKTSRLVNNDRLCHLCFKPEPMDTSHEEYHLCTSSSCENLTCYSCWKKGKIDGFTQRDFKVMSPTPCDTCRGLVGPEEESLGKRKRRRCTEVKPTVQDQAVFEVIKKQSKKRRSKNQESKSSGEKKPKRGRPPLSSTTPTKKRERKAKRKLKAAFAEGTFRKSFDDEFISDSKDLASKEDDMVSQPQFSKPVFTTASPQVELSDSNKSIVSIHSNDEPNFDGVGEMAAELPMKTNLTGKDSKFKILPFVVEIPQSKLTSHQKHDFTCNIVTKNESDPELTTSEFYIPVKLTTAAPVIQARENIPATSHNTQMIPQQMKITFEASNYDQVQNILSQIGMQQGLQSAWNSQDH